MIIEMYIYFYGIYGHDHRCIFISMVYMVMIIEMYIYFYGIYGHDHRDVYLFLWYIWS